MRRLRLILPAMGLILFTSITCLSIRMQRIADFPRSDRYFWWASIRLDRTPAQPQHENGCDDNSNSDCVGWDPTSIWIEPGPLPKLLVITAFPAFLVCGLVLSASSRMGISQVITFMTTMPMLIWTWFYFLGWLIDRRTVQAENND
jgi:hypothetical protein